VLGAALILVTATVATTTLLEPLVDWDVLAIWAYKATILVHEPVVSSAYFSDVSKAYSHLDYPLLWPLNMSWVWSFTGSEDLSAVKLLGVALLVSFLASCFGLLRMRLDRSTSLLFTVLLVSVPMLQNASIRMAADVPLSFFFFASAVTLSAWLESGDGDMLKLAAICATGLLMTKNEGMALFGILVVTAGGVLVLERNFAQLPRAGGWLVALPLGLSSPWLLFRTTIPKVHENMGALMSPSIALDNIDRLPTIAAALPRYLGSTDDWRFLWPLVLVIVILGWRACRRASILFLLVAAQLALLLYVYVYLVTPWDPAALIEISFSRLALHVAPVEVVLIALIADASGWLPWRTPPASESY
jgi:hypothetical protein